VSLLIFFWFVFVCFVFVVFSNSFRSFLRPVERPLRIR
jgi:hypothetical protein